MKYIVPKIFCALGAIAIFAGVFLSEINITLGNMAKSAGIAAGIIAVLLLFAVLAFNMKQTDNMIRLRTYRKLEFLNVFLFVIGGLASLLIFNHCITVWQHTDEIQKNLNISQLKNLMPEYESYAKQRVKKYEIELNEAIQYRSSNTTALTNLGFDIYSKEDLNSQKERKIAKLKQIVYPHTYDTLKISINDSIAYFINVVKNFSPLTAPKNIITIEKWAKAWEKQLSDFSHHKMKGEDTKDFQFASTFGNVQQILTKWEDFTNPRRFLGYAIGLAALICMLFPYFKAKRSNKLNY
jgi:hypothetical protein